MVIVWLTPFLISVAIGGFIRYKIWGSNNRPSTILEYGRTWAAYIAFFVPLTSINRFTKYGLKEGLISLAFLLVCFTLIAFICGLVYGSIKTKRFPAIGATKNSAPQEQDIFYEQALNELNGGNLNSATWARAMASSEGNIIKAKSSYIQLRVSSLVSGSNATKPVIQPEQNQPVIQNTISEFTTELKRDIPTQVPLPSLVIIVFGVLAIGYILIVANQRVVPDVAQEPAQDYLGKLVEEERSKTTPPTQPVAAVEAKKNPYWQLLPTTVGSKNFYVDMNTLVKSDERVWLTIGFNELTMPQSPLLINHFVTKRLAINCQTKALRQTALVQYDKPYPDMSAVVSSLTQEWELFTVKRVKEYYESYKNSPLVNKDAGDLSRIIKDGRDEMGAWLLLVSRYCTSY